MFFARQIRSAPVPDACFHNAIPVNPRSASSTMPGSKRSTSTFDNANSEVPYGPSSASKIAWVPHSASATRRAWGNADRSPWTHRDAQRTRRSQRCPPRRGWCHRSPQDDGPPTTNLACPALPTVARPDRTTPSPAPPRGVRAWKIADFDGNPTGSSAAPAHANPSVINDNTSRYEPSECNAKPIAKYAIVRAGNDRFRCSVRPHSAITPSTTPGGNTCANNPADTRSGNRVCVSGLRQPARAIHTNYTHVALT